MPYSPSPLEKSLLLSQMYVMHMHVLTPLCELLLMCGLELLLDEPTGCTTRSLKHNDTTILHEYNMHKRIHTYVCVDHVYI